VASTPCFTPSERHPVDGRCLVTETNDAGVVIEPADARSAEVTRMVASYLAEIQDGFGHDVSRAAPTSEADFTPPHGQFLVVRDRDGTAIGCCGVRLLDPDTAEVKRMWLHPSTRGRGIGKALLAAVEAAAVELGADRAVLDTNAALTTAISLYRGAGWVDVPPYNDNDQATHWFAKDLVPPPR
jgi:GNAT superfamily N-acetyltransferase